MPRQSVQRGNQYQKRIYVKASNEQRENIIKLVIHHKYKIADAAEHVGIGYENAKQILKVYHRQGRKHSLLQRPPISSKEVEEQPKVHAETKFLEKRKKDPKPVSSWPTFQAIRQYAADSYHKNTNTSELTLPSCPVYIKQLPPVRVFKKITA